MATSDEIRRASASATAEEQVDEPTARKASETVAQAQRQATAEGQAAASRKRKVHEAD